MIAIIVQSSAFCSSVLSERASLFHFFNFSCKRGMFEVWTSDLVIRPSTQADLEYQLSFVL